MNQDEFLKLHEDVPETVEYSTMMNYANEPLTIFEGDFLLKNGIEEIIFSGIISFNWVASTGAQFQGEIKEDSPGFRYSARDNYLTIINGLEFGEGIVTNTNIGNKLSIKGILSGETVFGDRSVLVEKIVFSIPNLRDFHGMPIKKIINEDVLLRRGRLTLENETYVINIDQCEDYQKRTDSLKERGGYIILFYGELVCKNGLVTYEDTRDIFDCLDTFITFLNGKRTAAMFQQGKLKNETIWYDYTDYFVDSHRNVQSWPQSHSIAGLNDLWQSFSKIWKNADDRNFLRTAIHWYVEANGHKGFSEGSIIMAQTALELLYNWFVVERKKLILGRDSENISAANKIRLLLSQLDISLEVPDSFTELQKFVNSSNNILDAPDAVVQIRNAIVHSQMEKRKKLSAIHYMAKYEALQLCIWYIEMALLRILDFNEKYFNRCSGEIYKSRADVYVPWADRKIIDNYK